MLVQTIKQYWCRRFSIFFFSFRKSLLLASHLREEGDSFFFGDAMTSFPLAVVSTEKEKLGPMLKEKEKGSLNFEDHEIKSQSLSDCLTRSPIELSWTMDI